jgi:dolichol-phosphate mannosyltransferase
MFDNMLCSYQVIVVDDGSTDKTVEVVQSTTDRISIIIEKHTTNLGLGKTIRDGIYLASKMASDRDIIITMDADDTHTPGLIKRMTMMINEGHDVVIASRYQKGSKVIGVPFIRQLYSYGASYLFRILMPIKGVKDYTCGYRAYRADVLKSAIDRFGDSFIDQDGFHCMVDILLKLRNSEIIFGEVPFILRYDYKKGESKMNVLSTIMSTIGLLIKRKSGVR